MNKNMDEKKMKKTVKRKKKKRWTYERKIMVAQIAIISVVFVLLLLSTAAVLTDMMAKENGNGTEMNNDVENTGTPENNDPTVSPSVTDTPTPTEEPTEEPTPTPTEEPTPTPTPEPPLSLTISLAGDCTLGADVNSPQDRNFDAMYEKVQDYGYFFKNVRHIFEADDLTIVNMEGTLSTRGTRQDKTFAFRGDPAYTNVLTLGSVEAANLANNHSKDYGWAAYTDTITHLEDAGISTFGFERTAVVDVKGVKVGLVGGYELAEGLDSQYDMMIAIKEVQDAGAELVIVSMHWGTEKDNYPDDVQRKLAHIAIDKGADLVVGHHPHVLQGIEVYKGKNIVYSLGNFCFGGNTNPSDKNTMIFQQTFSFEEDHTLIEDNVTNIIPCCVSSTWDYNDYCPTPLTGDEADHVMNLLEKYSEGLSE